MRVGVLLVGVGVVLAGCATPTAGRPLPVGGVNAESLHVTDVRPVAADGLVRLSPDGTKLLALNEELCVTALDGSGERCVGRDRVLADPLRAQWSPDGTRIVFTDDFWRAFREPDVWMFDTRSGELENLTDDGADRFDLAEPDPAATIDLFPSWSPDGRFIRFARGGADAERVGLMSVGLDGGEVAAVREIDCGTRELMALAWSVDQVAWTCGLGSAAVRAAGLSPVREWTVLPGGERGEDRMLLSFSPDGEQLLVDSLGPYNEFAKAGGLAKVVPVEGGEAKPVAEGKVGFPTWAPGGGAIVYVDLPGTLKVVAEPGGEPRPLRSAEGLAAADGMRLNWVPGTLLARLDGKPTLLSLVD